MQKKCKKKVCISYSKHSMSVLKVLICTNSDWTKPCPLIFLRLCIRFELHSVCFNPEETKTELKETCPKFALSLILRYVQVEYKSFSRRSARLNACFLSVVVRLKADL